MVETRVESGVCRVQQQGRWLATGWDGGYRTASGACNLTVPEGFDRTDLDEYVRQRLDDAGIDRDGPALCTGVEMDHARAARFGPVTAVATAGLSNPAQLPLKEIPSKEIEGDEADGGRQTGTVNLIVVTHRALADGALATLLATVVEAKTATPQQAVGFTGTTSDAVAVGCDRDGEEAPFAGSSTEVGSAARICVRDAVRASLAARSDECDQPASIADAEHGVVTKGRADVFRP